MSDEPFLEPGGPDDPAWTFRGYRLKSSEFVSAMAHEFRAEVQRTNVWRTRMDATTNWAIVVTGASISIAFSQPNVHHGVIILNAMLITLFLFIEARRFRYYEMWSARVRLMETDFFAAMLVPPFHPSPQWAKDLADNVHHLRSPVSMWEAVGLRLRHNYLWIFAIIILAWFAKYWLFPVPASDIGEFVSRAAIGPVPGRIVVSLSLAYFALLVSVAALTLTMTRVRDSKLHRSGTLEKPKARTPVPGRRWTIKRARNLLRPGQPPQFLALILTSQADAIAGQIMRETHHGVTAVPGEESTMLICALKAAEIKGLKALVEKEDSQASINIITAQEVLGGSFDPLSAG
jgi:uncharacterized membrane protein